MKQPIKRFFTVITDVLPSFGKIKVYNFTTSVNAKVTFELTDEGRPDGYFITKIEGYFDANELRELADECIMLADHLEGKKA